MMIIFNDDLKTRVDYTLIRWYNVGRRDMNLILEMRLVNGEKKELSYSLLSGDSVEAISRDTLTLDKLGVSMIRETV